MSSATEPTPGSLLANAIQLDAEGLLPAVVQQYDSGRVLMLAWMNLEAVEQTITTGEAHYYSRSRRTQWRKGETSGHTQRVVELRLDCDCDALLLLVDQKGVACHTGRKSCWFHGVQDGRIVVLNTPDVNPNILSRG